MGGYGAVGLRVNSIRIRAGVRRVLFELPADDLAIAAEIPGFDPPGIFGETGTGVPEEELHCERRIFDVRARLAVDLGAPAARGRWILLGRFCWLAARRRRRRFAALGRRLAALVLRLRCRLRGCCQHGDSSTRGEE